MGWPGNVRELANFIERAVILTRGTSLDVLSAELRRVCSDEFTQSAGPERWKEITQIVKETINALNVRHSAVDEHARSRRLDVRTLTETKGRVVATMELPHAWTKSDYAALPVKSSASIQNSFADLKQSIAR